MKIYLATNNNHKKAEIAKLFPEHTIVIPKDENIEFDPEETGSTFYENSIIKAKVLYDIVHCPVIADDSGLCVDALDGKPGIYTARYAGPEYMTGRPDGKKISQEEQNAFLVEQTAEAVKSGKCDKPTAHYTCAMVLYAGKDRVFACQETMEGEIIPDISEARGTGGFGYDPIFYLPEYKKTSAELTMEQKNKISHRGKASALLKILIAQILSEN